MRIRVRHLTICEFSRPVRLGPQVRRLRPRSDGAVELVRFALRVDPVPAESIECLDPDGNPEVYLPDAGRRGFDPTHGTPVADAHVALAAAAQPEDAAPVTGAFFGDADSRLRAQVRIDAGP